MIPTMITVGLILGFIPQDWVHRATATATATVLTSVAFGLLISEPVSGSLLALANVAVGIALGFGLQRLGRAVLRLSARRERAIR